MENFGGKRRLKLGAPKARRKNDARNWGRRRHAEKTKPEIGGAKTRKKNDARNWGADGAQKNDA